MTRAELIARTRQLVAEGDRLQESPSLTALQLWLKLSDDLLSSAWGSMDRYHLAWLMVGKPKEVVRGRPMSPDEEAGYVREVAGQKTAALRMSLDAVERQGMPFVGETGGVGTGAAAVGGPEAGGATGAEAGGTAADGERRAADGRDRPPDRAGLPTEGGLAERLAEARRRASEHADHGTPRAPRPDRMER